MTNTFTLPKVREDLKYEVALMRARYVYPKLDNPDANTIEKHAQQIYDNEMLERVVCETWKNLFRPLTYANVEQYFTDGSKRDKLLSKQRPYVQTKFKRTVEHTKEVFEYTYKFHNIFHVPGRTVLRRSLKNWPHLKRKSFSIDFGLTLHGPIIDKFIILDHEKIFGYVYDIFHVPSQTVIECKTYKSDAGLKKHKDKIREKKSFSKENLNDYYLLCRSEENSFIVEHFLSLNENNQFVKHEFEELIHESEIK